MLMVVIDTRRMSWLSKQCSHQRTAVLPRTSQLNPLSERLPPGPRSLARSALEAATKGAHLVSITSNFGKLKMMMTWDVLLTHYSHSFVIIALADASNCWIAAVNLHVSKQNSEGCSARNTLISAVGKYDQIEKEALNFIFAINTPQFLLRHKLYPIDGPQATAIHLRVKNGSPIQVTSLP